MTTAYVTVPKIFNSLDVLLDQLFNDKYCSRNTLPINKEEDSNFIYLTVEIPGIDKDEISIKYEDGIITITGEKKIENKSNNERIYQEIADGCFKRSINVGNIDFESADAELKNGLLMIKLSKMGVSSHRLSIK